MITLELFVFPGCPSKESALAMAKKAVGEVSGVKLILHSDQAGQIARDRYLPNLCFGRGHLCYRIAKPQIPYTEIKGCFVRKGSGSGSWLPLVSDSGKLQDETYKNGG